MWDNMARIDAKSNFLANTDFSDEVTFTLTGKVNKHNCCFWSNIHPHCMQEHMQYPQKLNIWGGISDDTAIRPFFIGCELTF